MKNDLTCAVVRDLLPSYVEGLTSDETNTAVERHLSACPDCMAQKNAIPMTIISMGRLSPVAAVTTGSLTV